MARARSLELRERAVVAVLQGGLSRRQATVRLGVAASMAVKWVDHFNETGSAAPSKMGAA